MSTPSAIIIIIAILAFTSIRIARYRSGAMHPGDVWQKHVSHRHSALDPNLPTPRESELQREIEDLRERVKVLERIATDDRHGKAIAAEIESLRDT